jgi:hypothetical protein
MGCAWQQLTDLLLTLLQAMALVVIEDEGFGPVGARSSVLYA